MNFLSFKKQIEKLFPDYEWTVPPDLSLGILATNQAFKLAKLQKTNPQAIAARLAEEIAAVLDKDSYLQGKVLVKQVGSYLNLDLTETAWQEFLQNPHNLETENLAKSQDKLWFDYVGTNVAKPMHAGHLLGAIIGEALRRILSLKYTNLVTNNYWGDWGVQFGILLWAWKKIAETDGQTVTVEINGQTKPLSLANFKEKPLETLVQVYVWGNQQENNTPNWEQIVRQEAVKLENEDPDNLALWQKFVDVSKKEVRAILDILHLPAHTFEFGESYYRQDLKKLAAFLDEHELWEKEGQARYFDFTKVAEHWQNLLRQKLTNLENELEEKNKEKQILDSNSNQVRQGTDSVDTSVYSENDLETKKHYQQLLASIPFAEIAKLGRCYLISSNGYSTYPFRDLTQWWCHARDYQIDVNLVLTDHTQSHVFQQTFALIAYLACLPEFENFFGKEVAKRLQKWQNLIHIGNGFLRLPGEKMSTRKGNFVTAKEIIDLVQTEAKKALLDRGAELQGEQLDKQAQKVAVASLKWLNLCKDLTQDSVLNTQQMLKFEGNTGVYQLYTLARLNSILRKSRF